MKVGNITTPNTVKMNIHIVAEKRHDNKIDSLTRDLLCTGLTPGLCLINTLNDYFTKGRIVKETYDTGITPININDLIEIKTSKDKELILRNLFPDIASRILIDSKYKPIVEVLWNGTHHFFVAKYPDFINKAEEEEATHELHLNLCIPLLTCDESSNNIHKDCILNRCYDHTRPLIYSTFQDLYIIYEEDFVTAITNQTVQWLIGRSKMIHKKSQVIQDPEPISFPISEQDHYFWSITVGKLMLLQLGKDYQLRDHLGNIMHGNGEMKVINIDDSDDYILYLFDKTTGKEIKLRGVKYIFNITISRFNAQTGIKNLINDLQTISNKVTTFYNFVTSVNWKNIILVIVVIVVLGLVVYVLSTLKPFFEGFRWIGGKIFRC